MKVSPGMVAAPRSTGSPDHTVNADDTDLDGRSVSQRQDNRSEPIFEEICVAGVAVEQWGSDRKSNACEEWFNALDFSLGER